MDKNCTNCYYENYPILFCSECQNYSDWENKEVKELEK